MAHTQDVDVLSLLQQRIKVNRSLEQMAAEYRSARPFPHIVIDNMFRDGISPYQAIEMWGKGLADLYSAAICSRLRLTLILCCNRDRTSTSCVCAICALQSAPENGGRFMMHPLREQLLPWPDDRRRNETKLTDLQDK